MLRCTLWGPCGIVNNFSIEAELLRRAMPQWVTLGDWLRGSWSVRFTNIELWVLSLREPWPWRNAILVSRHHQHQGGLITRACPPVTLLAASSSTRPTTLRLNS
jgi:hypothetical protein